MKDPKFQKWEIQLWSIILGNVCWFPSIDIHFWPWYRQSLTSVVATSWKFMKWHYYAMMSSWIFVKKGVKIGWLNSKRWLYPPIIKHGEGKIPPGSCNGKINEHHLVYIWMMSIAMFDFRRVSLWYLPIFQRSNGCSIPLSPSNSRSLTSLHCISSCGWMEGEILDNAATFPMHIIHCKMYPLVI